MTAKEKVMRAFPTAFAYKLHESETWGIFLSGDQQFATVKHWLPTESEAWAEYLQRMNAAESLPQPAQELCQHCQSPIKPIYPMNPTEDYVHIGYGDTCDFQYCINGGTWAWPVEPLPVEAKEKEPELYYIQDKRSYCGNSCFWWKPDGNGYTCNLDEAWKVTREKAESMMRHRPDVDVAWPVAVIDSGTARHFDMQQLREIKSL
jgi:hypothetical protein